MFNVIASKIKSTQEQEQAQGLVLSCEQQEQEQGYMAVTG